MLLNMDCFGLRHASDQHQRSKQQYLTADVNRSLQIYQTSLNLSNNSQLTGGSEGKLMAVAEGRGSTATASRAATLAIDQVATSMIFDQALTHTDGQADSHVNAQLADAIQSCQQAMNREAQAIEAYRDMSANIGVGYVLWPNLHFIHLGPVHCLMLRNGWLTECSNVGGALKSESEGGGIAKRIPLRLGDRIMICTHALKNTLEEFDFKHAMSNRETAAEICESIISRAHENQSGDCSLIVACFDEGVAVDQELQHDSFPAPAACQSRRVTDKNVRVRGTREDTVDQSARRLAERNT